MSSIMLHGLEILGNGSLIYRELWAFHGLQPLQRVDPNLLHQNEDTIEFSDDANHNYILR